LDLNGPEVFISMTIVIVHPYHTNLSTEVERDLTQKRSTEDAVVLLSVMSESKYRGIQSAYRSLRDVDIHYSIDHAQEAAYREANRVSAQVIEPLGFEVEPLGRVGGLHHTAAAVARAYGAESVYFTDDVSWVRRWYRRRRLRNLGFTGQVHLPRSESVQESTPEPV
jgi:hypothetical protein